MARRAVAKSSARVVRSSSREQGLAAIPPYLGAPSLESGQVNRGRDTASPLTDVSTIGAIESEAAEIIIAADMRTRSALVVGDEMAGTTFAELPALQGSKSVIKSRAGGKKAAVVSAVAERIKTRQRSTRNPSPLTGNDASSSSSPASDSDDEMILAPSTIEGPQQRETKSRKRKASPADSANPTKRLHHNKYTPVEQLSQSTIAQRARMRRELVREGVNDTLAEAAVERVLPSEADEASTSTLLPANTLDSVGPGAPEVDELIAPSSQVVPITEKKAKGAKKGMGRGGRRKPEHLLSKNPKAVEARKKRDEKARLAGGAAARSSETVRSSEDEDAPGSATEDQSKIRCVATLGGIDEAQVSGLQRVRTLSSSTSRDIEPASEVATAPEAMGRILQPQEALVQAQRSLPLQMPSGWVPPYNPDGRPTLSSPNPAAVEMTANHLHAPVLLPRPSQNHVAAIFNNSTVQSIAAASGLDQSAAPATSAISPRSRASHEHVHEEVPLTQGKFSYYQAYSYPPAAGQPPQCYRPSAISGYSSPGAPPPYASQQGHTPPDGYGHRATPSAQAAPWHTPPTQVQSPGFLSAQRQAPPGNAQPTGVAALQMLHVQRRLSHEQPTGLAVTRAVPPASPLLRLPQIARPAHMVIDDGHFVQEMKTSLRARSQQDRGRSPPFPVRQARRILQLLDRATVPNGHEALHVDGAIARSLLQPNFFFPGPIIVHDQQLLAAQTVEQFLGEYYNPDTTVYIQDPNSRVANGTPHVRKATIGEVKARFAKPLASAEGAWNCLELATHRDEGTRPLFLNSEECSLLTKVKIPAKDDMASRKGYEPGWKEVEKWALLAQAGALTEPHQDSHGYSTHITVNQGIVGFGFLANPSEEHRAGWRTDPSSFIEGPWRYVILRRGDTIFFPCGTVHFVFRIPSAGHTLAFGGHILRNSQIVRWLQTMKEEILSPEVTNEDITVSAPGYIRRVEVFVKLALKSGNEAEMSRWGGREAIMEFLALKDEILGLVGGGGKKGRKERYSGRAQVDSR